MPWSGDVFSGQDVLGGADAPLIGPDDFAEWYGIVSPTNDQLNRIQTACEIASAMIRNGRRVFTPVTNEIELIDANSAQSVLTSRYHLPVTAVSTVETFNGESYDTVDVSEYQWTPDGVIQRLGYRCWPGYLQGVRVTYNHGYAVLPRDVAGVCLRLAGRLYTNPGGSPVLRETLGDASVEYANTPTGSGGLLPDEEAILSLYESNHA